MEIKHSPSHEWGDDWPYWNELYKAEQYISSFVRRYTLCGVAMKEKYGTLRYEFIVPPRWTWHLGDLAVYNLWSKVGRFVLDIAINRAAKKFPNCRAEILDDTWWRD